MHCLFVAHSRFICCIVVLMIVCVCHVVANPMTVLSLLCMCAVLGGMAVAFLCSDTRLDAEGMKTLAPVLGKMTHLQMLNLCGE